MNEKSNKHIALKLGCSSSYIINSIVAITIMIGFKYVVPSSEPLTPLGVEILGIFLGTLYAWLVVGDMIWPSIVCLVLLGLSDYTSVIESFAMAFGNNTVLLLLFFFVFTNIINSAGIIEYIAKWLVTRKFSYGKPWVLSFLLMIAAVASHFMVSATAACLVMIPLIKSISLLYGFKAGDKWPMLMMFGLVFVGSTSYIILPYKPLTMIVFSSYEALTGAAIVYSNYLIIIICSIIAAILMFLFSCKFLFKPDISKIKECNIAIEKQPLNSYQKFIFGYFAVVITLLMLPNFAPEKFIVVKVLKDIGNVGILALAVVFYVACNFKEGKTINQLFEKNISWNLIFLIASALTISSSFKSETTGISLWLCEIVAPMAEGKSPFLLIVLVGVSSCIMSNLSHNQAVCSIFTPILVTLGTAFDMSIPTLVVCMMAACNVGMITPLGSATGAMLHSDKEWIPNQSAVLYGLYFSVLNVINTIFIIYPLGNMLL